MKDFHQAAVELMGGQRPGRLLDAGSGGDEVGKALSLKGFDVVSLDLYCPPLVKDFVRADMNEGLPFRDMAFDYVLCSETLQYLDNHAMLFKEFRRVLRKGGALILSLPNVLNADSRLYFLMRGFFPHFKPVRDVQEGKAWDSALYHPVSLVEIMGLAGKTGFELKGLKVSKLRKAGPLYLALKAMYSLGLAFGKKGPKADIIRKLSSRDALLGDHLILMLSLNPAPH